MLADEPLVDDGKKAADTNRRYKMAYSLYGGKTAGGIHVAFSPDGIHFTDYDQNPVLADEDWDLRRFEERHLVDYLEWCRRFARRLG